MEKPTFLQKLTSDLENKKPIAYAKVGVMVLIGIAAVIGSFEKIISSCTKAAAFFNARAIEEERTRNEYLEKKTIADKIFVEVLSNLNTIDAKKLKRNIHSIPTKKR